MFAVSSRRVLPGFTLSLGTSLLFVCLILLLPLSALVMQLSEMSWAQYWEVITNPQVVAMAQMIGWPQERGLVTIWIAHTTFCSAYVCAWWRRPPGGIVRRHAQEIPVRCRRHRR